MTFKNSKMFPLNLKWIFCVLELLIVIGDTKIFICGHKILIRVHTQKNPQNSSLCAQNAKLWPQIINLREKRIVFLSLCQKIMTLEAWLFAISEILALIGVHEMSESS